ncbi:MAG: 4Fe-4S dicluster domain-containing protein [Thermodesulfobacteriota bacterium]|nr:4Fe-4S dicluster domain-containing protein [Thermodesulfobacteriota bacterium]
MEEKTVSKEDFFEFLAALTKDYQVFAPVKRDDCLVFAQVQPEDEICLDYHNTKRGVKEAFFPQREQLFSFNLGNGDEDITEPSFPDTKRVMFGVRPCDAKGLFLFDRVFGDKGYEDPYYLSKRANTIVIALGCSQPESTCFCIDNKGGPFATDGSDLLLVDLGDSYSVQVITEKGEELLKNEDKFRKADQNQVRLKEEIVEKARAFLKPSVNPEKAKERLDKNFDDPIWDRLHEKCLGCGICTFLCPTCHCFDILDETGGPKGERIRIWDSCMFPQFTLHASGANPRPTGKERLRQRVMHKFKYFVDNHGEIACSGCGRCIRYCPVNLDIREILGEIQGQ